MIENANKIQWNKRLIYPVTEPSDEIVVSVFDAENDDVIGTIKLPLSCMEDGYDTKTRARTMNANAASVKRKWDADFGIHFHAF